MDVTDEVQLARIALAARDDDLARAAVTASRRRADLNPGATAIAASASHVRGLVDDRRADLERAVELFERGPRPLAMASALEDLGAAWRGRSRDAGVEPLGRALAVYTELGATWDARRVRSRLRKLGVRRRIVPHESPTSGWGAMTPAELAVARLVAEGLTNQEVADRLYVSPHTVNSHLRHIFTKVEITSRVELARVVAENNGLDGSPVFVAQLAGGGGRLELDGDGGAGLGLHVATGEHATWLRAGRAGRCRRRRCSAGGRRSCRNGPASGGSGAGERS